MYCMKCGKHLAYCECPDLQERLEALSKVPQLQVAVLQNQTQIEQRKLDESQGTKSNPQNN